MPESTSDHPHCLNCGAELGGQYCGRCGQRATNRLISIWELLRDAFGDLFELDSRLWRTLIPLLVKPGHLTSDYLRGRRMRYMPPFRMYLVLSLVFFVIVFFDPRQELAILFEPGAAGDAEAVAEDLAEAASGREEVARGVIQNLVRDGVVDEAVLEEFDAETAGAPAAPPPDAGDDASAGTTSRSGGGDLNINFGGGDAKCQVNDDAMAEAPAWLQRRITVERLRQVCERVVEVGPAGVVRALLDNIPVTLLLLLPLMALVMKLLYPLAMRYYVEHLLFIVHFHAFVFLLLTLQVLWARLVGAIGMPAAVSVVPIVATSLYIPVYLYKSMRRVYGQGRLLTVLKFLLLSAAYIIGLSVTLIATVLITVFSV